MTKEHKTASAVLFISVVILGIFLIKQLRVSAKEQTVLKESNVMQLAYEIIEISNSNFNLQNEVNRLKQKNDNFSSNINDKAGAKENLENKLEEYEVINGVKESTGSGVEISVEGGVITEELVDLINGIRNTKPKAIGINGKRVIYKSYFVLKDDKTLDFDNKLLNMPLTIQVIGNTEVLESSLSRAGGILDIIKKNSFGKAKFEVKRNEKITIPPYDGKIIFREAKLIS